MTTIGSSWSNRPIELITIADNIVAPDQAPALLLVSGLDGSRPSSVAMVAEAAKQLLESPESFKGIKYYIIPCANPDALLGASHQTDAHANRNSRPVDEDRDGNIDEDAPRDINGDGAITMMRRICPPANDPPTHLPDPGEPRLMRTPDQSKDQRASHTLYVEGFDADHDGLIAEDAVGGVDIDRNFPHRWQEFDPSAGRTQLSEPESQAIARFVLEHPNIIGAIIVGRCDTLVKIPDAQAKDSTGRTPLALDGDDKPIWDLFGGKWRELSGQSRAAEADLSGSLALWLYAHRGIPAFAVQGWGRPDASPPPPPVAVLVPAPVAPATTESAPTAGASGSEAILAPSALPLPTAPVAASEKPMDEESAGWLAWSDRDQAHAGFIEWTPFEHPTLGAVEIGGFRAGFRTDPPPPEVSRVGKALADFLKEISSRKPLLKVVNVTSSARSDGMYEIEAEVINEGWLPTATAMGRANRQAEPVIVRLSLPKERILSGQRVTIIDGLAGAGGRKSFRWLVAARANEPVTIDVQWKPSGTQRVSIIGETVSVSKEVMP